MASDTLAPLSLPPGLFKNGTRHQAQGRWYDANLVRFFDNTIRPVGGWRRLQSDANADFAPLDGVPRAALAWRADAAGVIQVIGTTSKLYAIQGGVMHDITPAGYVAGNVDTSYTTASGAYGIGDYGSGNYGVGSQTAALTPAATWQLTNFGNALVAVSTSDKKLYVWLDDPAVLPTVPAGAPSSVRGAVVTPERFLFVLGAQYDAGSSSFIANDRSVAWPSQETTTDWVPSALNTAGDFEVASAGRLVCGRASRGQTLLWTDADLHAATFIGGPFVYSFSRIGENCGIASPNAVAMLDGQALWMGRNGFFRYDGFVKPIECEVQDYVFGDINTVQLEKVWAVVNAAYGEVWFYYPSASSNEIDSYVVYNYLESHWTVGKLQRTAGYDAGAVQYPVWLDAAGVLYEHERLNDRHSNTPRLLDGSFFLDDTIVIDGATTDVTEVPYIESGPLEIGNGDTVMKIQRVIPDAQSLGDIDMRLFAAFDPTSDETIHGPFTLTQPTDVRITARQVRVRYDEVNQVGWRIGTVRLGIRPSSRR